MTAPYYHPKTARRRGVIYGLILAFARRARHFTADNLTPALAREQAASNCRALARQGRLRVVRPGKLGHGGRATVYEKI